MSAHSHYCALSHNGWQGTWKTHRNLPLELLTYAHDLKESR
jgi:hypothetical protein